MIPLIQVPCISTLMPVSGKAMRITTLVCLICNRNVFFYVDITVKLRNDDQKKCFLITRVEDKCNMLRFVMPLICQNKKVCNV